jgi:hypothetical protein
MANKETIHPWQQIEEQAFHSFREWPLWLVLRRRELAQQTGGRAAARPALAAPPDRPVEQPPRD